jgi:hypothetical protein
MGVGLEGGWVGEYCVLGFDQKGRYENVELMIGVDYLVNVFCVKEGPIRMKLELQWDNQDIFNAT